MKTKLKIMLLVLILISCTGVKKSAKTNVDQKEKTNTEVSKDMEVKTDLKVTDKSEKVTDKSLEQIETETNELETRIILYDTDKPIVPGTNKPPVKEEKVISNKKQSKTDIKTADNSTAKTNITANYTASLLSEIDSLQKVNASLIAKTDTKETQVNNSWYWWLIGGMCIPVVGFGIWKFG